MELSRGRRRPLVLVPTEKDRVILCTSVWKVSCWKYCSKRFRECLLFLLWSDTWLQWLPKSLVENINYLHVSMTGLKSAWNPWVKEMQKNATKRVQIFHLMWVNLQQLETTEGKIRKLALSWAFLLTHKYNFVYWHFYDISNKILKLEETPIRC